MITQYEVCGSLYNDREEAVKEAVLWWGSACGTQDIDPCKWSEEEIKESLQGWCKVLDGSEEDQSEIDEEVISKAIEMANECKTRGRPLADLVEEFGGNAIVIADAGNGSAFGDKGIAVDYDQDVAAAYGDTVMHALDDPHVSDDGVVCHYASDWITQGDGANPYRVMVYF